ncbi:MAG TPA: flavodoxin family protein [Clostridia bacterium]|nr:flavodoxin family protein [Clostridia bacterium]
MKKVIGFSASPRKGNTDTLIKQALIGAETAGAKTKFYKINDLNIKGCQSCFYCRSHDVCAVKDDMQEIYEDLRDADAVVIGSPIYFFQAAGQLKIFLDRLYPMVGDDKGDFRYGQKKGVLIFSQGSSKPANYQTGIDMTKTVVEYMGIDVADTIVFTKADGVTDASNNEEALQKALEAGKKLVG